MELKWSVPEYYDALIPCLGGLHIAMNFLKVIGRHMDSSGLLDIWLESGVLGANATEQVMSGISYAPAVRIHKLTYQALWQMLLPEFMEDLDGRLLGKITSLESLIQHDVDDLISMLAAEDFQSHLKTFEERLSINPSSAFIVGYMRMISTLLSFIRAQREGNWELYLASFKHMVPYFFRYDHINYARWGTVFLAEMESLPSEVHREFLEGNFIVKRSKRSFNQVSPDQSTEWLNAVGKKSGGLVGITRMSSALNRWSLSFNLRSDIVTQTKRLLSREVDSDDDGDDDDDDDYTHNECHPNRLLKDEAAEKSLLVVLDKCHVFQDKGLSLKTLINNDIATTEIQESLLGAESLGRTKMLAFIESRINVPQDSEKYLPLKPRSRRANRRH